MGPTWGPPGPCRPQMGPMLAPWTLPSGRLPLPPCFEADEFKTDIRVNPRSPGKHKTTFMHIFKFNTPRKKVSFLRFRYDSWVYNVIGVRGNLFQHRTHHLQPSLWRPTLTCLIYMEDILRVYAPWFATHAFRDLWLVPLGHLADLIVWPHIATIA